MTLHVRPGLSWKRDGWNSNGFCWMSSSGGSLALGLERAGSGDLLPGGFSQASTFLHMLMLPVFQGLGLDI